MDSEPRTSRTGLVRGPLGRAGACHYWQIMTVVTIGRSQHLLRSAKYDTCHPRSQVTTPCRNGFECRNPGTCCFNHGEPVRLETPWNASKKSRVSLF